MKIKFIENKWEYEIRETFIDYGYEAIIYKDNIEVKRQGGFGSINNANQWAIDEFLLRALDIDLNAKKH